jgi:hypothetical protein
MKPPLDVRFWAKVDKINGPVHPIHGRCWEWIGSYRNKYGQIANNRKNLRVNRVGFELQCGPIPVGLCVCHKCDNPRCVRGDHFFLGTQQENTADRQAKGRQARGSKCVPLNLLTGDRHWTKRLPERCARGEDHPMVKLTEANVREIINRHAKGEAKNALSKAFGVSRWNIRLILAGKSWSHLPLVAAGELVVEAIETDEPARKAG